MQPGNVTEDCIEALKNSSYATPRDRQLIAWLELECIMKEVTQLLGLTPPDTPADVTDVRTQSTIKAFETRLGKWEKELPPGVMNRMCWPCAESDWSNICLCTSYLRGDIPLQQDVPSRDRSWL